MKTETQIQIQALEALKAKFNGEYLRREVTALISRLAGPDNRFKRQALYREITGENILVAQAGINRLIDTAMKHLNEPEGKVVYIAPEETADSTADSSPDTKPETKSNTDSEKLELTVELGLLVIRKACKRTGVVHAVDGDKITVLRLGVVADF